MKQECIEGVEDAEAFDFLVCPLTKKLFEDPVLTRYGHTYERAALLDYLAQNNNQDPKAGMEIDPEDIHPNIGIMESVKIYKKALQRITRN